MAVDVVGADQPGHAYLTVLNVAKGRKWLTIAKHQQCLGAVLQAIFQGFAYAHATALLDLCDVGPADHAEHVLDVVPVKRPDFDHMAPPISTCGMMARMLIGSGSTCFTVTRPVPSQVSAMVVFCLPVMAAMLP